MNNYDWVRPETRAFWKFEDSDGTDSGPYSYDLTDGYFDAGIGRFGNVSLDAHYLSRSTSPLYLRPTTFSVCAWVKRGAAPSAYCVIYAIAIDYPIPDRGYMIGVADDKIELRTSDGSGPASDNATRNDTISISENKWRWIVVTRSVADNRTRFYIDGKLDGESYNTPLSFSGTELVCVGAYFKWSTSTYVNPLLGLIDNVHVMGVELDPATIRNMYAFQMGRL